MVYSSGRGHHLLQYKRQKHICQKRFFDKQPRYNHGILKKFAPLEKLANTLQIDELKEVSVNDIKNYIQFANGKVLVKPFSLKVKDIEMLIGGTHENQGNCQD